MGAGDPPERSAITASIKGSMTAFAGRSGSSRAQARPCNKRTARGDNRPESPDQAVNRSPLPFFHATPALKAVVILLDQPPMPIPVYTLPCLFERRRGDRGKPHPFQQPFGISRLLFPDANDPHGQGLLAHSRRVRVEARASSDHRKARAGSNAPGDRAWLEPRWDGLPGWERLVRAEAQR
jgi:hypothetical protein